MLVKYEKAVHPVGKTLSDYVHVYHIKVLRMFLKAGVPMEKIGIFGELLEENAFRLCDSSNSREFIPFIRKKETS